MPTVTRDENHIYRVDGVIKPFVSQVCDLFFPPSPFYTIEGREKGKARHLWYHAIAQGLIIENEAPEIIAAEVAQFRRFWAQVRPEYVSGEELLFDSLLGVCGTPDLVARINGRLAVVDFKPEAKNARTPIQTAAYFLMLKRNGVQVLDRYEIRLSADGYRLDKHRDPQDLVRWPIFVAAFNAAQFYK